MNKNIFDRVHNLMETWPMKPLQYKLVKDILNFITEAIERNKKT